MTLLSVFPLQFFFSCAVGKLSMIHAALLNTAANARDFDLQHREPQKH
jgi:hypothetical protein